MGGPDRGCLAMKLWQQVSILFVLVILALGDQYAWASPRQAIIGQWQEVGGTEVLEFFKDGTVVVTDKGMSLGGRYQFLDADRIKLELMFLGTPMVFVATIQIVGDILTLFKSDGTVSQYRRIRPITLALLRQVARFVGEWENVDLRTPGITRIVIRRTPRALAVRMWGKCQPVDCDWGERSTGIWDAEDGVVFLEWKHGFAVRRVQISLLPDERLRVSISTRFTDNSGRADYTLVNTFMRRK